MYARTVCIYSTTILCLGDRQSSPNQGLSASVRKRMRTVKGEFWKLTFFASPSPSSFPESQPYNPQACSLINFNPPCHDSSTTTFFRNLATSSPPRCAIMDEASRLVLELQAKLTELDTKVFRYHQEMASAFTTYKDNLLRDVPKDVLDTVTRAISAEIYNHPYFQPAMSTVVDSSASTGSSSGSAGFEQMAPDLGHSRAIGTQHHTPEHTYQMERGSHDRELEFRGVFTPGYLPLLDGSDPLRTPSSSQQSSSAIESNGRANGIEHSGIDASTGTTRSLAASPDFSRPIPRRKNTDEVSFMTDTSDGFPKSALRRASTSSHKPQSPRQVRFNIVSGEVLPTSSPLPHEAVYSTSIPNSSDGHEDPDDEYDEDEGMEAEEDSTSSYLLGDSQDSPPRKKKLSSTARLRALSRAPLEDATEWTTVSGGPDDVSTSHGLSLIGDEDSDDDNPVSFSHIEVAEPSMGQSLEEQAQEAIDNVESNSSSEDEMVIKPKKRLVKFPVTPLILDSSNSKQNPSSSTQPRNTLLNLEQAKSEAKLSKVLTKAKDDKDTKEVKEGVDDVYELPFDLEDVEEDVTMSRSPLPEIKEDSEPDSSEPGSPVDTKEPSESVQELKKAEHGTPLRAPPRAIGSVSSPVSTGSTGRVGSYKGHPFSMPIVSDEVQAMAASLGNMQSYVGGMSGRTGIDESNAQSFKESFGGSGSAPRSSFSGTPKSFSERMAMENLLEDSEGEANIG